MIFVLKKNNLYCKIHKNSSQPSAVGGQIRIAISNQQSAISNQRSAVSCQRSAVGNCLKQDFSGF